MYNCQHLPHRYCTQWYAGKCLTAWEVGWGGPCFVLLASLGGVNMPSMADCKLSM